METATNGASIMPRNQLSKHPIELPRTLLFIRAYSSTPIHPRLFVLNLIVLNGCQ
jgi:hypothetical protein